MIFNLFYRLITRSRQEESRRISKSIEIQFEIISTTDIKNNFDNVLIYTITIVKEVYGGYIENVTQLLRSINNERIETLPFTNISFSQQKCRLLIMVHLNINFIIINLNKNKNPSISPFARFIWSYS